MAEASSEDDQYKCPICIETYIQPRSLPTCRHTFCENCLLTFALKLKSEDRTLHTFDCPVCRSPQQFPENEEVSIEWIRTFPKQDELSPLSKTRVNMNTGSENEMTTITYCDPCKYGDETNPAKEYCTACLESLCVNCVTFHKRSKPTRNHRLIALTDAIGIPENTATLGQEVMCSEHNDRPVEVYCQDEDVLCCTKCATFSHRHCTELHDINAPETIDSMYSINEMLIAFTDIKAHYEKTMNEKEETIRSIFKQLEISDSQLKELKQSMYALFDRIEMHLKDTSTKLKENATLTDGETVVHIKSKVVKLNETIDAIENIAQTGSNARKFIACRSLWKDVEQHEQYIKELDKTMESKSVGVVIDPKLMSLIETQDVKSLIELTVTGEKMENAYTYKTVNMRNIVKVQDIAVQNSGGKRPTYSDVVFMADGSILLLDSCYNYCSNVRCAFTVSAEHTFGNCPGGLAVNNKNIVYISFPGEKKIEILSMSKDLATISTIPTKRQAKAIVSLNTDTLGVSWNDPVSFSRITIEGSTYTEQNYMGMDSDGRTFKTFEYLAVDKGRLHIIQPCTNDKAVYCFKYTGEPVFRYSENLGSPRGVDVDRDGNIYVCDKSNHSLHQVSPDGIQIRLMKDGIPESPLAISINKQNTKLILTHGTSPWDRLYLFEFKWTK